MTTSDLAVDGGRPVREPTRPWPAWPQASRESERAVLDVLASGRWTISAPYDGGVSHERRFARAFAEYTGSRYCIPTASGTAGLLCALEACGVGAGDEVVIPAMTWIANVSSVLSVNATPVLADVEPDTLCLDADRVESLVTSRTAAIVAVHLYGALCDMARLRAIADAAGVPLIEDCAQAHGAMYEGLPAGRFGDAGVFSMQHTKLLTCGEGGAVVTGSATIADAVEHLRADGRSYRDGATEVGDLELTETGRLMGSNMALSEFQAAVLLGQLPLLDEQNAVRTQNAAVLGRALSDAGLGLQATTTGTTRRVYYKFPVRLDEQCLVRGIDWFADAVSAELHAPVKPVYPMLTDSPLYRPSTRPRFSVIPLPEPLGDPSSTSVSRQARLQWLAFDHQLLLGDPDDIAQIAAAFTKVRDSL